VALAIMILIAIVFAALGTALGSLVQDMQGFQLLMNFLVLPIFFLSGALFPLDHLPKALAVITALDPLTYGIDALRHTLINAPHFGLAIDFAVLVALGAVFLAAGARLFSKIQI
jgi:ABC-2 type transport system permease protein